VPVHEVTDKARLEATSAVHPVTPEVGGRMLETRLILKQEVRAEEILVVFDAEAEKPTSISGLSLFQGLAWTGGAIALHAIQRCVGDDCLRRGDRRHRRQSGFRRPHRLDELCSPVSQ
jgi:hypothetical protein